MKYDVCATFICDVYTETFCVTCGDETGNFPDREKNLGEQARDYNGLVDLVRLRKILVSK